ncbi:unnamed protein product, partial [marine sediment metagenome]
VGVYTLNPEPDNIPANSIILAEIWVPAGATEITGAEIYDKRVSIADFLTHESATTGVHGVGAGTIAKVGDIAVDANLSVAAQDAITKRHDRSHDHSNALDGSPIAEAGVPNHMSKNKLAFTANKLLKGAGVGVNPTEIDPYADANAIDAVKANVEVGDLKAPTGALAMNGKDITGAGSITASELHGTTYWGDIYFEDVECLLCHRKFKKGDKLILMVNLVKRKSISAFPVHQECGEE